MSPFFHYRAVDSNGQQNEGTIEATNKDTAILNLQNQQLIPLKITKKTSFWTLSLRTSKSKLNRIQHKHILDFTQTCTNLLKSSFPIDKAIITISHTSNPESPLQSMCQHIFTTLEKGHPLSLALKQTSPRFSSLYISLVRAGEQTGQLSYVFERLNQFLKEQHEFRKTIKAILLYPCMVLSISLVSIGIMLGFVVPRFVTIFEDLGQALPWSTQLMVNISNLFRHNILYLATGFLGFVGMIMVLRRSSKWINFWHTQVLRIPYAGTLQNKIITARFCSTLGMLIEGGLTIVPALSYAQDIISNRYMHQAVQEVKEQVQKGIPIHRTMQRFPQAFSPLLIHMLAVGEETGNLSGSLGHIANTFETDVRNTLKTITTMLSPLLILAMGLVIALIIAAMLLPLLNATDINI